MINSENTPLDGKKVIKKTLVAMPLYILIFLGLSLPLIIISVSLTNASSIWIALVATLVPILVIGLVAGYQYIYFKTYRYNFEDNQAEISKGVISRSTGFVRYARIQNIYVDQDVLDRIFGLYDVHYETAGETSSKYSHVDGLNKQNADKLLDFLREKADKEDKRHSSRGSDTIPESAGKSKKVASLELEPKSDKIEMDRESVPMEHRLVAKKIITSIFGFWFIMVVYSFGFLETSNFGIVLTTWSSLTVVYVVLTIIYQSVWFKNFQYQFKQTSGYIRTSVISQNIAYIYYDRIQNINVTQSVIDRIFNLFTVSIETAADTGTNKNKKNQGLRIQGLSSTNAEKIRDFLMTKAQHYRPGL